jgi:hypothetical protein
MFELPYFSEFSALWLECYCFTGSDRHEREELMTPAELQERIYKTYFWLRGGLCLLAFVFPFLLWRIGSWNEIPLQNSISDYYFAFAPPNSELRAFPGRVVFVGVLFALGFFLILYRGFSSTENWTLNIAGLSALIVALFPTKTPTAQTVRATHILSMRTMRLQSFSLSALLLLLGLVQRKRWSNCLSRRGDISEWVTMPSPS